MRSAEKPLKKRKKGKKSMKNGIFGPSQKKIQTSPLRLISPAFLKAAIALYFTALVNSWNKEPSFHT